MLVQIPTYLHLLYENMQALKNTEIHFSYVGNLFTVLVHPSHPYSILYVYKKKAFTCIHAYIHIQDLLLAAGSHTDTLISIQATQTHFQVLSVGRGHKMVFIIRPSSPLRVEQVHTNNTDPLSNGSLKWSPAVNKSKDFNTFKHHINCDLGNSL